MGRRDETISRERWRVRLYRAGERVDTSPNMKSREAAEAWAHQNPRASGLDVQLWCRSAGSSRFEPTLFGWSNETAARP